jgi:LAO/AO transport system kinase
MVIWELTQEEHSLPKPITRSSLKILTRRALNHDRRAIAQLISVAENDPYARFTILSALHNRTGRAYVIGITGPPGAGKSTLIAELTKKYREDGYSVGIVAIDPTSELTGGALLGDRIRMADLASDPKVFIRSMATRGQVGGIARATEDVVRILDASSTDYVLVETAGAGQSDVDIKTIAHTTVVVTAPGLGDEIQALKAGIMEIGDIFVVNKADREDAETSAQQIHSAIAMSEPTKGWRPLVLKTTALSGQGISALVEAITQHQQYVKDLAKHNTDKLSTRKEIIDAVKRYFEDITLQELSSTREFAKVVSQVQRRKSDPYKAARRIVRHIMAVS